MNQDSNTNPYEHLFGVRGKVALVTGGTRGIGLMITEGLVRCGAKVYISSRKVDACREAESELSGIGDCVAIPGDVSNIAGCEVLAADLAGRESRLDILVNNAGFTWSAPIDEFSEKAWDKVVNLNAKGLFFLTQKLLPLLRAAGTAERPASVVNISSVNGLRPSTLSNYSYSLSKGGLTAMSQQMAHDLLADHVNINVIAPGLFKSKMTEPLHASSEAEAQAAQSVPLRRWGSKEDIAGLTIFLSSRAGAYLTGAVIACDGGVSTVT